MRFMIIVKASKDSEAGIMPSEKLLADMGKFNEELANAGVLLAADGLHPTSKGARVKFSGSKRTVVDGPFTETKEQIAGFWLWQVKSKEEAIEWVKRCPNPHNDDSEIEIDDIRSYNLIGRSYWNARDLKIFSIANPRATVSDMEAEARLILSGRYLGYLPDHFASRYVSEGLLRPIRPDLFSYKAPFQAAFDKSRAKSGLVPFFVKLLVSEFDVSQMGRGASRLRAGR